MNRPDDAEPVFEEPWQAQAFAMQQSLQDRGLFSSGEWADALGAEIKRAQADGDPDDGSTYYRHWLAALERLVVDKGLVTDTHLDGRRAAWDRAAHATPHGLPITLDNDPLAGQS